MKVTYIQLTLILLPLLLLAKTGVAQTEGYKKEQTLSYSEFLKRLGQQNLEYAAELLELDIAIAEAESASIFQDPNLSFEAADNGERRMQMGYEFESALEWTLELGGKRKARIRAAQSQVDLRRSLLTDYFRNLRADATLHFLNAIKEKALLKAKTDSYEHIKKLADSDSIRYALGDISEVDARQSKLEAATFLNELYQQEADWESAIHDINKIIGKASNDTLLLPTAKTADIEKNYSLAELIQLAQENRSDLKAALQEIHLNQNLIQLLRAERKIDLDLSLGIAHATVANNEIAPTPAFTSVKAGIAVPLKFSNKNKGEIKAAQYSLQQSELLLKASEINIQTEVKQAYSQYIASRKQIEQFDTELLQSAQRILNGKTYSYQRGETSLLEVLNAQRTFIEIQESYFNAQYNYGASLVELQRAAGIWNINL